MNDQHPFADQSGSVRSTESGNPYQTPSSERQASSPYALRRSLVMVLLVLLALPSAVIVYFVTAFITGLVTSLAGLQAFFIVGQVVGAICGAITLWMFLRLHRATSRLRFHARPPTDRP